MNDFLVKPIRRNVLLSVVDRWLTAVNSAVPIKCASESGTMSEISGPVPIDLQVITKEFEEKELVQELLLEFLHMAQDQLRALGEAINRQDFEAIRLESHSLKSGADSLAAGPLAQLAGDLEFQSREQKPEKMAQTLQAIEQEFGRVQHLIEAYMS